MCASQAKEIIVLWKRSLKAYLLSSADATTMQHVDVLAALVHEPADEPEVTEDDRGHFGDILVALPLADVATVIHQAGHQIALALFLFCAFFDLWSKFIKRRPLRTLIVHTGKKNYEGQPL